MNTLLITNIKCSGCAKHITSELEKSWITHIHINFNENNSHFKREITFEWDIQKVKNILWTLGYPEYGSDEAKSLTKKLKSFVSCALWKFK